jgi:hypothetical protein
MRRLLGLPFEVLNVLGTAFFFTIALFLTLLSAPGWLARVGKFSPEQAADHFHEVASLVGRNGLWVAGAALLGAIVAPYARGDGKKVVAWIRIVCATMALVLVFVVWGKLGTMTHPLAGDVESARTATDQLARRSDRELTPWNGLLLATALNLLLGAAQVSGGAAKKAKGAATEK